MTHKDARKKRLVPELVRNKNGCPWSDDKEPGSCRGGELLEYNSERTA